MELKNLKNKHKKVSMIKYEKIKNANRLRTMHDLFHLMNESGKKKQLGK